MNDAEAKHLKGLAFRVQGSGGRVVGVGLRAEGLGVRVEGCGLKDCGTRRVFGLMHHFEQWGFRGFRA